MASHDTCCVSCSSSFAQPSLQIRQWIPLYAWLSHWAEEEEICCISCCQFAPVLSYDIVHCTEHLLTVCITCWQCVHCHEQLPHLVGNASFSTWPVCGKPMLCLSFILSATAWTNSAESMMGDLPILNCSLLNSITSSAWLTSTACFPGYVLRLSVFDIHWRISDKVFSSVMISAISARLFRKLAEHNLDSRPSNLALSLCCPLYHPLMPLGNVVPRLYKNAKLQWLPCTKKLPSKHWTLFQSFWGWCVGCEHIHLAPAGYIM